MIASSAIAWPAPASAQARDASATFAEYMSALFSLGPGDMAALALMLGVILFGVLSAILLVRTRAKLSDAQESQSREIAALRAERDDATALLLAEPQILVVWGADDATPEVFGKPASASVYLERQDILAFAHWLVQHDAIALESAVSALRARGEGFTIVGTTLDGVHVEAEGRAIAGRAVLRVRDVSGIKRDYAELAAAHERLAREVDNLQGLLETRPLPAEIDTMRADMGRMVEAHRRILDQLSTAVAVFAADQRLIFYNSAYRTLWDLDASFLNQNPTDATVLEKLRASRKLPEQVDFGKWVAALHQAYRATKAEKLTWHLPDGRTLRVVTAPDPEGGITYLFDDVTERYDLARRNVALEKVRNETLDNLAEGVAVFASDGRLSLSNKAFARLWRLAPDALAARPHVETVIAWLRPLYDDPDIWQSLRGAVTGLDQREPLSGQRLMRVDGSVLECASLPLPDGATLVTFQDITDSVNVERALRERAEALETTDKLKNDFIHHVSYELRSPLTNIIGFAQLLEDPTTGALTDKQREYLGYIGVSSSVLLAIINDILDLATIDAGAMRLALGDVDIRGTMEAAAEGVKDRLVEKDLKLDIVATPAIGSFTADERRMRQVLYNLLSNAVGFSPPGDRIEFRAERRPDAVVFAVSDHGPGIPPAIIDRVFERFESHALGSEHRGAGLGLAIVRSLVELHGGKVTIESRPGAGTKVTCIFPLDQVAAQTAAE